MILPLAIDREFVRIPYATYGLMALNTFLYWLTRDATFAELQPFLADPQAYRFTTSISSCFLHADVLHLASNMYFLWIYGRYVEDRLGPLRYVILFVSLGVFADAAYAMVPDATLPSLGASGAIAALMGLVFFGAPRLKVRMVLWEFTYVRVFRCPLWIVLGLWIGSQLWYLAQPVAGINFIAHISGFLAGMLLQVALRQRWLEGTQWSFLREATAPPTDPRSLDAATAVFRRMAERGTKTYDITPNP